MKAIIGLVVFLAVFSLAKSFVTTLEDTVSVLEKNASKTEKFYTANNLK
jgi:hypothetical protein